MMGALVTRRHDKVILAETRRLRCWLLRSEVVTPILKGM